jgi:tetratricopeptide (TPR) repeat protein
MVEVGIKYAERGFADKAEAVLARSEEMDPEDSLGRRADLIYEIGSACYNTDQFKEAIPWFQRLVDEYPGTEYEDAGMRRLAYAQHGAGDSETAVATYRKLLAKTPDDPSALNGFAWFCASRAIALDEALPVALKAVELSNRSPGILDTLAELYYARGEYDKAIEIGKEALASDPDDQYFQDQVKKFKEAKAEADSQAMR